jgi:hypothetical protein
VVVQGAADFGPLGGLEVEVAGGGARGAGLFGGGGQGLDQLAVPPGLENEITRALFQRLDRKGHAAVGGHQDDREARIGGAQPRELRQALIAAGLAGDEVHVEEQRLKAPIGQVLAEARRAFRRLDALGFAGQRDLRCVQHVPVVVDHKHRPDHGAMLAPRSDASKLGWRLAYRGLSCRKPGARMVSPGFSLVAMSWKFGRALADLGS